MIWKFLTDGNVTRPLKLSANDLYCSCHTGDLFTSLTTFMFVVVVVFKFVADGVWWRSSLFDDFVEFWLIIDDFFLIEFFFLFFVIGVEGAVVGVRGGVLLAVDDVPSTIWVLFIRFNFFHEFNNVSWLVLTIKSSL